MNIEKEIQNAAIAYPIDERIMALEKAYDELLDVVLPGQSVRSIPRARMKMEELREELASLRRRLADRSPSEATEQTWTEWQPLTDWDALQPGDEVKHNNTGEVHVLVIRVADRRYRDVCRYHNAHGWWTTEGSYIFAHQNWSFRRAVKADPSRQWDKKPVDAPGSVQDLGAKVVMHTPPADKPGPLFRVVEVMQGDTKHVTPYDIYCGDIYVRTIYSKPNAQLLCDRLNAAVEARGTK